MTRAEYDEMVKRITKEEIDNAFQKAYEFGAGYTSTGNEKMITYIRTLERTVELLSRQVRFDDEVREFNMQLSDDVMDRLHKEQRNNRKEYERS